MALLTITDLRREQLKRSFSKTLTLEPTDYEVFDQENNRIVTHYNDLNFLIEFQNNLTSRGFIEGTDFYFEFLPTTMRLTLVNGNTMYEYNGFHDLYFLTKPQPIPLDGLIKYFYSFTLISNRLTSTLFQFFNYFSTINSISNRLTSSNFSFNINLNPSITFSTNKLTQSFLTLNPEVANEITH